jgi:hypothetical protein
MSQPHPPIPEPQSQPQPETPDDDPRTQSILLPPSQRPSSAEQPAPAAEEHAEHIVPGFGSAPGPSTGSSAVPVAAAPAPPTPIPTPTPTPGPPPVPGPSTTPGSPFGAAPSGPPPVPSAPGPGTSAQQVTAPVARHAAFEAVRTAGRSPGLLAGLLLGVAGLVMLEIGLVLGFGSQSLWDVVPTWSAFATVAALLVLVPAPARAAGRPSERTAWRIGAVGAAGVVTFWVLIGLPLVASDRGFWLTAAAAAAGAAVWLSPGRGE